MRLPKIMILDRDPDYQGTVINIEHEENTIIIHALEDITVSLLDGNFPSGTLRFKAGQVICLPDLSGEEE